MCCPIVSAFALRPTEAHVELTCRSEDPRIALVVETKTDERPRTPSVVLRTCELSPTGDAL